MYNDYLYIVKSNTIYLLFFENILKNITIKNIVHIIKLLYVYVDIDWRKIFFCCIFFTYIPIINVKCRDKLNVIHIAWTTPNIQFKTSTFTLVFQSMTTSIFFFLKKNNIYVTRLFVYYKINIHKFAIMCMHINY